ncbi:MAG TPA: prolyl oligopeptidase family serine peptidase [Solirubrobacteraceae bacterium]
MRRPVRGSGMHLLAGLVSAAAVLVCVAAPASARAASGMPSDVPAAGSRQPAPLPEPSSAAWPFPSSFPQTSGTGRLAGGASLWTDFIYDDYGATAPVAAPISSYDQSSTLAPRHGDYVFPAGAADNNGADIFRAGIGLKGNFSYWRVDWVTLADPSIPIAEWTFDTDNNAPTGASAWPAEAGVSSPGIDQALVVSSRGAWLVNPITGIRTNVAAAGGSLTVDTRSKSFIVAIPRSLLPVGGTWRVRLASGLADAGGQNFAPPYVGNPSAAPSPTAERVYNVTFRTVAQEPTEYTSPATAALVSAAELALGATPIGQALGADGLTRSVTGNFWMENDQAETLAGGNLSKFSQLVDWSQLASETTTPEAQPTGYSARWYASSLQPGAGQVYTDGGEGNFKPTLLERIQPYAVYVPSTYRSGHPTPLTWILHSLEVNYNQYGALDPQLIQQLCQDRGSICATTEGFGPAGWYYNEAESDFWQVWHALAQSYSLNPARTVISGYSMGGWASYKLAFEHPDDFAAAFSMDGPVVCGIEFYPGEQGNAFSDPACSQDGQSKPFIHNALWVPYVMDHTFADELVPVQGPISQAEDFDKLGQRYDLFIHTGGDHLAFATEDRFGDAVAAVGEPVRKVNPGSFTYSWYPSLNNAALGIGATGDYWLSRLGARNASYGTIATVQAYDADLPEQRVTDQRFGPSLVTQPLPGTETRLSWTHGSRPAARRRMTLQLTDVSGLTLDATAARLRTGTITVVSDGTTRFTIARLPRGTEVLEHRRVVARAGSSGIAAVNLGRGTTVLVLVAPHRAHRLHRVRRRYTRMRRVRPNPTFTG